MAGSDHPAAAACLSLDATVSVEDIVARIESEELSYVFVGERHASGPVKRFAVELTNALVDRGHDVGLYVEGFRAGCMPHDAACRSLAGKFNARAFVALLREVRAPVHGIDPPEHDGRVPRMAATIAAGPEAVRVVLVGRAHVVDAGNPDAQLWVYGGGMRYPDPGDLVEAFPRERSLTLTLEPERGDSRPYALRADGCRADYTLAAAATGDY
ncbi:MAG: hypothetical protein ACRD0X_04405 [Thermoanaerobaculia bacterium]